MTTGANSKDPRLLGALDNLDHRFIAEVTDSLRITSVTPTPARKRAATLRSVRYIIALAACVLLLSAIIPTVSYLVQNGFITPGGIYGTDTTDTTATDETTAYPDETTAEETAADTVPSWLTSYIPDNVKAQIINAYMARYPSEPQDASEYRITTVGVIRNVYVIFIDHPDYEYIAQVIYEEVAGYAFTYTSSHTMTVYYKGQFYSLPQAYREGILTEEHIAALHKKQNFFYS